MEESNNPVSRIIEEGNTFIETSAAKLMAQLQIKLHAEKELENLKMLEDRKTYIDNGDYSPSLEDFREEIKLYFPNKKGIEYTKYLRDQKKRYTNIKYYFNKWSRSELDELLLSNYSKIINEIKKLIEQLDHAKTETSNDNSISAWAIEHEKARVELFHALRQKDFISQESTLEKFFQKGGITKWTKYNSTLFYLLQNLISEGFIKRKLSINEVLKFHFINRKGQPLNSDSANSTISRSNKPYHSDEIDSIVVSLPKIGV